MKNKNYLKTLAVLSLVVILGGCSLVGSKTFGHITLAACHGQPIPKNWFYNFSSTKDENTVNKKITGLTTRVKTIEEARAVGSPDTPNKEKTALTEAADNLNQVAQQLSSDSVRASGSGSCRVHIKADGECHVYCGFRTRFLGIF